MRKRNVVLALVMVVSLLLTSGVFAKHTDYRTDATQSAFIDPIQLVIVTQEAIDLAGTLDRLDIQTGVGYWDNYTVNPLN